MCSNKLVCTSIKVCVQSPAGMSLYVCNAHPIPGPGIDCVSAGVGGAGVFAQWPSPAVCARQCSRGQTGVEVSFYVRQ